MSGIGEKYAMRLAGKLPKDEGNGLDAKLAEQLAADVLAGRTVPPRAAVIVWDVDAVQVGTDGSRTVMIKPQWILPVVSDDARRKIEQILHDEFLQQAGALILPHHLQSVLRDTFADLPLPAAEIDRREEAQRDGMSEVDEIRMHLQRVHGLSDTVVGWTDDEVTTRHGEDHDPEDTDALPLAMQHEAGWIGWTRADLEIAESDGDGDAEAVEQVAEELSDNDRDE